MVPQFNAVTIMGLTAVDRSESIHLKLPSIPQGIQLEADRTSSQVVLLCSTLPHWVQRWEHCPPFVRRPRAFFSTFLILLSLGRLCVPLADIGIDRDEHSGLD